MIKIAKSDRCAYPPNGRYISPPSGSSEFSKVAITQNFTPRRLLPECSRQSLAEGRILSRIQEIENGLTSQNADIIGR